MQTEPGSLSRNSSEVKTFYIAFSIFLLYLGIRIIGWKNVAPIVRTDSIYYIEYINVFLTFKLNEIINLNPDFTPFYLFFSALFSLPGWSVETGARLCSLAFSLLLFWSVIGIGRHFAKPLEIYLGLILITLSPVLISLSYEVLTEPSYIATIYLGLWIFWTQFQRPVLWKAALLGVIFGLGFLNRVEGIIYLAVIPFLQLVHYFLHKSHNYKLKYLGGWSAVFIIFYCFTIAPQIWRVSSIMGEFSLNGRTVWSIVLNNPDGKSKWEKIYSLDYSPSVINITYLQHHPETRHELQKAIKDQDLVRGYLRTIKYNLKDLFRSKIDGLIGWVGATFFIIGLFALYQYRRFYELLFIPIFIAASLVAPLIHNVAIRHIVVIAPLIFLVSAIGIVYAASLLKKNININRLGISTLSVLLAILTIAPFTLQYRDSLFSLKAPQTPHPIDKLREPVNLIQKYVDEELQRKAVICAQSPQLAFYANGEIVRTPFTQLTALVKYLDLNKVDFLYLDEQNLRKFKYPFYDEYLMKGLPTNYKLIYQRITDDNKKKELYRIDR